MSTRYTAVLDEDLETIHRAHIEHALATVWLFVVVAGVAIIAEVILYYAHPDIWVASVVVGFVVVLFFVVFFGWRGGMDHLDAQTQEYRADKLHQREMQKLQHELEATRYQLIPAAPIESSVYGYLPSNANTMVLLGGKPSAEFIQDVWTEGSKMVGDDRTVKGEDNYYKVKWGDKVPWDAWLGALARAELIAGRSRDTRKPGTLTVDLNAALDYFHYPTALPQ